MSATEATRDAAAATNSGVTVPIAVVEIELADGLTDRDVGQLASPAVQRHARYRKAVVLVKLHGEPLGTFSAALEPGSVLASATQRHGIEHGCAASLRSRGIDPAQVAAGLVPAPRPAPVVTGVMLSLVICTRDHPDAAIKSLHSLQRQELSPLEIIVVDNAPADDGLRRRVGGLASDDARLRYVREPRPGLSWARNAGLHAARGTHIAWIDDDEIADVRWTRYLTEAFTAIPRLAAVSGSVLPAEFETAAQVLYENYGGHTKGRGFVPDVFDVRAGLQQSPLYPLPPFGVGANMAFDVEPLRELGGFDTALGAGTVTHGGEDTLIFTRLLLRKHRVGYVPNALVWHTHRRDYDALRTQMIGYGVGLTAFYCALLAAEPATLIKLVRLLPFALRDALGSSGSRLADVTDFPPALIRAKNRAMLRGPLAYLRARVAARRLARREWSR